ncbi:MAG: FkbM family methyltransferase [Marivirga sp.]|jgi:FkbM family methyltransferase
MKKFFFQAYKRFVFNLSAKNSLVFKFFYSSLYKPSKGSLAYFYDQVSRNLSNIFVVQVGANDGINHDPIHKFVKRDGWKGVLIEPQPDVFRYQLFPLYMRNKGIYMENIAISNEIALMDMYKISFSNERWATGLTTFHKPTLQEKVDRGDVDIIAERKGIRTPKDKADYINQVKVEAKTFDFIRAKYQITDVDVLQIDVEGFDFEVVKLYDLSTHKPKVIVFESGHLNDADYAAAEHYFKTNDYLIKRVKGDSVAVHKQYTFGVSLINSL